MTTRECLHLVTGSYFRLHNKDGGHAIRSVAHLAALCVDAGLLLAIELLHCGAADLSWHAGFRCDCTGWLRTFLLLWPRPRPDDFIYEPDPYSLEIGYTGCANMNFVSQGFRKLSSYRHTDYRHITMHQIAAISQYDK